MSRTGARAASPDNRAMNLRWLLWATPFVFLPACTPTLNWREIRPEGSGAIALFPCKPSNHVRTVRLGLTSAPMALYACNAGGVTYAFAHVEIGDPHLVGPALTELRASAAANLGAQARADGDLQVPGMTPNAQAGRIRIEGKLPSGELAQAAAGFFVKGTRVFQVTVVGPKLDGQALEIYLSGLKLTR
jgi:hypothetical protein